jgi:hypothetical protein
MVSFFKVSATIYYDIEKESKRILGEYRIFHLVENKYIKITTSQNY